MPKPTHYRVASNAKPSPRTQAQRRTGSSHSLVQAAIEIVARDGVGAMTFEAIGIRAGYSRSLVTQRFGSKQGLLDAVLAHLRHRRDETFARHHVDDMRGRDAVIAFIDLYLRYLDQYTEPRAYFLLLSSAIADTTSMRPSFAAEHERVRARLSDYLRKGRVDHSVRPDIDADAAAMMVGSLLLGLSMQLMIDPAMNLDPIRETSLIALRLGFET